MNRDTLGVKMAAVLFMLLVIIALGYFLSIRFNHLQFYQHVADSILNKHFIRIRHLSSNSETILTPDADEVLDSCALELKDYVMHTDSTEFIVTNKNHQQPNLKFLFLGGSTTACLYVDEDKRIPENVTRRIEQKTGLKINVWNAGSVGTHSYHSMNLLLNCAWSLKPDYAFFYANINDIATLMHYGTYYTTNPDKGVFFSLEEYYSRYPPPAGIFSRIGALFSGKPEKDDDYADARGRKLFTDSAVVIGELRKVFVNLIAICKSNNIQPVLITQVNNFDKFSYEWFLKNVPDVKPTSAEYDSIKQMLHYYNQCFAKLAAEENVTLIDLRELSLGFNNFYSAIHFNSRGADEVSQLIAEQFVKKTNSNLQSTSTSSNF